ncbi:hypothetical protein LXL04_007539 [Taraxacum kok-saghyz]
MKIGLIYFWMLLKGFQVLIMLLPMLMSMRFLESVKLLMCLLCMLINPLRSWHLKCKQKYKKYWGDVAKLNHFMFLGVVLDPRHKWQYIVWVVQNFFGEISVSSFLSNLESNIRVLFDSYNSSLPQNENEEEVIFYS